MASAATMSALADDKGAFAVINDPQAGQFDTVGALYRAQLDEAKEPTPRLDVAMNPVAEGEWRFRARHRGFGIVLRTPPEPADPDLKKKFRQQWIKKFGSVQVAAEEKVQERLGDRQITFRPVAHAFESVFETRDPLVAEYVRGRLPEFNGVAWEEMRPQAMQLGDETIFINAADPESAAKLARHLAALGG